MTCYNLIANLYCNLINSTDDTSTLYDKYATQYPDEHPQDLQLLQHIIKSEHVVPNFYKDSMCKPLDKHEKTAVDGIIRFLVIYDNIDTDLSAGYWFEHTNKNPDRCAKTIFNILAFKD